MIKVNQQPVIAVKPINISTKLGDNEISLLKHAIKNAGYHAYSKDPITLKTVTNLESKGLLMVKNGQFKLKSR